MLKYIVLCFPFLIFSQNFMYESKIQKVSEDGFYKVLLNPEIRSLSKNDYSDLRLFDSKNNEIAYFIKKEDLIYSKENFIEFKIKSFSSIQKKESEYIIENPKQQNINSFFLEIANTSDRKNYSINGSNDEKNWFSIASNQELINLETSDKTSILKQIYFPNSNYLFYKIIFNDKNSNPINILKFGIIKEEQFNNNNFIEIPIKSIKNSFNKEKKQTEITINLKYKFEIDKIKFIVSNPKMFYREGKILQEVEKKYKKKTYIEQEIISNIDLDSKTHNEFIINDLKTDKFKISIDNFDDFPLEISSIKLFQKPIYLIADLKENQEYIIKTGNEELNFPLYDLDNFKNSIPNNLSILKIEQVNLIKNNSSESHKKFYQESWFMWICIVLGGSCLLFFSLQMLSEMKK